MRHRKCGAVRGVLCGTLLAFTVTPAVAEHIPAFARRYGVSCALCHNPVPALTPFGEQFAANGNRMAPGEEPADTIGTGDDLLALSRNVPLAVRLDAYVQSYANGRAVTDFQTPYSLKLLSGGSLSKSLSYYFYAFLFERGEVGGVEDAYLYANDVGGAPVDVLVGQFQVSDPMFKRELRLSFEDYAVYRARLGEVPSDLTYDRGVLATADVAGFALSGQVVNGNGRGAAGGDRHFDSDAGKTFVLHATRDITTGLRLGAFGYAGRTTSEAVNDVTHMLGADATISHGPFELNLQYLHRSDSRPFYVAEDSSASLDGGFAELLVRPAGSRWHGFALYNLIDADRPVLSVRLGGPALVKRYETVSGGVGYLLRRNLRLTGEMTYDISQEEARWTLGAVSAF
jgi:hypothetical protein